MFLRWLLTVAPREMAGGWRLVRRDLALWIALSTLLAVAAVAVPTEADGNAPVAGIVYALTGLTMVMLPPLLFTAAVTETEVTWGPIFSVLGRRVLGVVVYSVAAVVVTYGVGALGGAGAALLLHGTPMEVPGAVTISTVLIITFLVRFSFLPFLLVLYDTAQLPQDLYATDRMPVLGRVLWPLYASTRMTEPLRWHLAGYVVIVMLGPLAARGVPAELAIGFAAFWQMLALVVQAVLFEHFLARAAALGMEAPTSPIPAVPAGEA